MLVSRSHADVVKVASIVHSVLSQEIEKGILEARRQNQGVRVVEVHAPGSDSLVTQSEDALVQVERGRG
tara:strand:+ start:410 stop:616 length:207 start_codon:yes stop_codon:yes gene_type:complete